ncbi:MAG: phospholipase D-like domain-containing protein [Nocardioides sp.]|uniref:phospholipase D-like domain-containing protein n=1 Tax=Nocardioides sp. TaxID=35761 RepID=UPI0039E55BCA
MTGLEFKLMRKTHRLLAPCALVLAVLVGLTLADSAGATPLAAGSATTTVTADAGVATVANVAAKKSTKKKSKKAFRLHGGAVFNSATGGNAAKYRINNKLKAAIDHARKGSWIRIMSWNIMSKAATDHLLKAQKRGVTIHVLMDASNWSNKVPNPQFRRLKAGLRKGNKAKSAVGHSAAKVCHNSCRGKGGAAHAKYYLFGHSGKSKQVVMEGSANLTLAAARNQWNDLYTWIGRKNLYNFAVGIFDQAWHDKAVKNQWQQFTTGPFTLAYSPDKGKNFIGNNVTRILSQVKCKGATNTGNHRTVIRLFPDVMRGKRGLKNARQIKALWNKGCNVKVGYTVLSYKAHAVLTSTSGRGKVPLKHMVQDFNGDGQFDNYFHLKVLTVRGVIGSDKHAYKMTQGSSNLSGLASLSDENIGIFTKKSLVKKYEKHLSYWYAHAPRASTASTISSAGAAARTMTLSARTLLTPSGRPAADSDGYIAPGTKVISPTTGKVVNPYANVDAD